MHLAVFGLGIKKNHVGLDPLRVENARGQTQHGVHVTGFQQFFSNFFTCAAALVMVMLLFLPNGGLAST